MSEQFDSVVTQAGINAGASAERSAVNGSAGGGFTIDVQGATTLTGGVISSGADAANNSLTTGTLTARQRKSSTPPAAPKSNRALPSPEN